MFFPIFPVLSLSVIGFIGYNGGMEPCFRMKMQIRMKILKCRLVIPLSPPPRCGPGVASPIAQLVRAPH
ncbi:hypothetical protein C7Y71_002605 [Pseudoprevotella muciniphila]|uniref:Uncharacterized protein n=1 Tax=Pseudoprevotella muciniphila TaxID=2133944 RepID=A0A5P8E4V6_9BACT|nr:hypothetical protein C7Y71_002605 [Pseudoprevotella muciniphila]